MNLTTTDPIYRMTPQNMVHLTPVSSRKINKGDCYELNADIIHTTYPKDYGTMTILIQQPVSHDNFVYMKELKPVELEKHHRLLSVSEVLLIIDIALANLKKKSQIKAMMK